MFDACPVDSVGDPFLIPKPVYLVNVDEICTNLDF